MKRQLHPIDINNVLGNFYNTPCALLPSHHEVLTLKLNAFSLNPFTALPEDSGDDDDQDSEDDLNDNPIIDIVGSTAVITIAGNLVNQCSALEAFLFNAYSLENLRAALIQVANADSVKNILLSFASGGGSTNGLQETADLINDIEKAGKNVYAYTNSYCCSAAYFLASQAQGFFASQSAIVGAIGVYSVFMDTSKLFQNQGIEVNLFKAGDFKGMGTPGLPLTKEQKAVLQKNVDDLYAQFTSYVKAKRPNVAADTMQGLTYNTKQAINLGLVDGQVNNLSAFVDYLNK